jgi:hypothetical protein
MSCCGFKADRIPRFGARFGFGGFGADDLGWSPVAAVFPEFIARENRASEGLAVKERSAGLVRPAAAGEDTALRALTARHRGLRSTSNEDPAVWSDLVYGWNGTGKSTLSNLFSCFELRSMVPR